jgi:peptidoglycan/xylan/chitin deacetylase (PgdA/CDA1 family)
VSVSACITVEFDAMALWTSFGKTTLSDLSRGDFERFAVPRLLRVFDAFGVTATWFVPGAVAELYPQLVHDVLAAGHELGHHGWAHEDVERDEGENRRILERGIETLERLSGAPPRGYRVPGGFITNDQIRLLAEYGFEWDSSLEGGDFEVYYVREGDTIDPSTLYRFGREIDLVEIPVTWNLDDFPAFEFVLGFNSGLNSPSQVLEMWQGDFDWAVHNVPGGIYSPCLHSQVIGRGHRLLMLERLLEHITGVADVHFETITSYVTRWKEGNPLG